LFRRVVPLPWNKVDSPDPSVKTEVIQAGQAVFNWAYEGLQRLNARGRFDIPAGLLAEREAYRVQNDIPLVFISDTFDRVETVDDQGKYVKISQQSMYDLYRKWCSRTVHKPFSSITFAKELRRLGIEKTVMDGRTFYLGLKPKDENPNEIEVEM
jgi:phage/plasmid-associated DNA primase